MADDVTASHAEFQAASEQWERCRDVHGGADSVKAKGTRYLPRLPGTSTFAEYNAYRARALFYPTMGRTVQGLHGAIFRKPPDVQADFVARDLEDVTLSGVPLATLAPRMLDEVLIVGRHGVLIDFATGQPARPYWIPYRAENITNWATAAVNGRTVLTLLVLRERVPDPDAEPARFSPKYVTQYRVLELVDGALEVSLWRDSARNRRVQIVDVITPTRRGAPLPFIPFVFFGPDGTDPGVSRPPLLDLADVNLSHFRSSADLEHGRHWTALPTPWVSGYSGQAGALKIGSSTAWALENPQARAGMLEFQGQGLGALEKALEHKESLMAILGARLLESRPRHQEAADTVRLRQAGEVSVLQTIASALGAGLTAALKIHTWWAGRDDTSDVLVTLNHDFFEQPLGLDDAVKLVQVWQAHAISRETLFYNLQQGELTRPGVTFEDEQAAIAAERGPTV